MHIWKTFLPIKFFNKTRLILVKAMLNLINGAEYVNCRSDRPLYQIIAQWAMERELRSSDDSMFF